MQCYNKPLNYRKHKPMYILEIVSIRIIFMKNVLLFFIQLSLFISFYGCVDKISEEVKSSEKLSESDIEAQKFLNKSMRLVNKSAENLFLPRRIVKKRIETRKKYVQIRSPKNKNPCGLLIFGQ